MSTEGGLVGSLYDLDLCGRGRMHFEIIGLDPGNMIALRWSMGGNIPCLPHCTCLVVYFLESDSFKTKVTERIEMLYSEEYPDGWIIKILSRLTESLRKFTGISYVRKLKRIVERDLSI